MASTDFRASARADETASVWVPLITLTHSEFATRRIAKDSNVTSRGERFSGYPLRLSLPRDTDDGSLDGRLEIEDVERTLIAALRSADSEPAVTVEIVRADAPETVEFTYNGLELRDMSVLGVGITGVIGIADQRTEPIPADAMTPDTFPGLF